MVRIAVDAMGGDHAPGVVVAGALEAAEKNSDLEILLVGQPAAIERELENHGQDAQRIRIVPAADVIGMDESPVESLRRKPDSSLRVMARQLKEAHCEAIFSAGNTGAMVAAATMTLGLLPGVRRAGIAVALQLGEKPVVLMDVGANIEPKPQHLYQYGVMASELAGRVYGVENPKIALLNVGEEEQKGNVLVRETRKLFRESGLSYVGNVEGGDIFDGRCDVVICDGFVGNIVLKVGEGVAEKILQLLFRGLKALEEKEAVSPLQRRALRSLVARIHYSDYGGAPLLGVNGVAIIGHGRSDAKAISNALAWAGKMATTRVNDYIIEAVSRSA